MITVGLGTCSELSGSMPGPASRKTHHRPTSNYNDDTTTNNNNVNNDNNNRNDDNSNSNSNNDNDSNEIKISSDLSGSRKCCRKRCRKRLLLL